MIQSRIDANDRRVLLAIPVYNEAKYVHSVLTEVRRRIDDVLVIDDGSTDETPQALAEHPVEVIRHASNRGYGRSMQDMMRWAAFDGFDWLVTMDCDEQHEPAAIPRFLEAIERDDLDVVSGSRYLDPEGRVDAPPADRRRINGLLTGEINRRLGLALTDAFCGFKAYRVSSLAKLQLDVDGYDFPMQFWVQAAANDLRIGEIPVRLIYNDPSRSFGGPLDDADNRLAVYRRTYERELERCRDRLPAPQAPFAQPVA
ncbi:MAG: glycosyltransferase family 2 protein [Planctomycetota bacterium]|nr:glycosyltransferase family 2 protein [Planctomycetota bacterium]